MSTFQEKLRLLLAQFGRFLVVGGISFSADFDLSTVLYGLSMPHLIASTTSFSTLVVLNCIPPRCYVFEAQENVSVLKEFMLYALLNVVALGLNTLIPYVCADLAGVSLFLGKTLVTAIVLIYNFISYKALLERLGAPGGSTTVHHPDGQAGSRIQ